MEYPMSQLNDLSRSLTSLEQDNTIIAVIEMSQSSWLVAGIVPGIERHPLKKLEPNEGELLRLLMRWRAEATKMGCTITRVAVAYEAGRDGFWLARWLRARDIETYVIHPTSVAVSREHRRAKTDRLDTGLLKRVFIGWLRGEPDHCHMVTIPTLAEEDLASGTIYVLRSKSDHPAVAANRDVLHKIGVTGGDVDRRVANTRLDPTFLMADVEIVATYKLANISRTKLENLIHRIFDPARLDIEVKDRLGNPVTPREWFLVPVFVIDEAVERIKDGTITEYIYDSKTARLVRRGSGG
jgi:hypothetical protein